MEPISLSHGGDEHEDDDDDMLQQVNQISPGYIGDAPLKNDEFVIDDIDDNMEIKTPGNGNNYFDKNKDNDAIDDTDSGTGNVMMRQNDHDIHTLGGDLIIY